MSEEQKETIDVAELAALHLEMLHPKNFRQMTSNMSAKEISRVFYNIMFFPYHEKTLMNEKEKRLYDYCDNILKDKQTIYVYSQERKEKENEQE